MTTRAHESESAAGQARARSAYSCPVCASGSAHIFWEKERLPVFCNVLCETRETALAVPRGDIRLAVCPHCAFIWNVAFKPELMDYHAAYENTLRHSPTFREYADRLVRTLVAKHDLHGKIILEIACGDGDFLRQLCAAGGNRGIGFDPTTSASVAESTDESVRIIRDYYGEQYAEYDADLIVCRHALEHIPDPLGFLRSVRANIGHRETAVFFEVPNAMYTFRDLGIWDILYEHCSYFSGKSLGRAFECSGFRITALDEQYDNQFLTLDALPRTGGAPALRAVDDHAHGGAGDVGKIVSLADSFAERFDRKLGEWRARLTNGQSGDQKLTVWGAGTKGVMFLNLMAVSGVDSSRLVAVDINPKKQGKFVAGAGIPIIAPRDLPRSDPCIVVVMNAAYEHEVRRTLLDLGIGVDVETAGPSRPAP